MLVQQPGLCNYLFNALETTPELFAALLHGLTDREADFRPVPERFSIREALSHLADWEEIFFQRLQRTRNEDEPFLPDLDEGQLAIDGGYAQRDTLQQLQLFSERRAQTVAFVRELSADDWQRPCHHERAGRLTLEGLTTLIALHDTYHLRQIVQWRGSYADRS